MTIAPMMERRHCGAIDQLTYFLEVASPAGSGALRNEVRDARVAKGALTIVGLFALLTCVDKKTIGRPISALTRLAGSR